MQPERTARAATAAAAATAYPSIGDAVVEVVVDLVLDTTDAVARRGTGATQTARAAATARVCAATAAAAAAAPGVDVVVGRALGNAAAVLLKVNARRAERETPALARTTLGMTPDTRLYTHTHSQCSVLPSRQLTTLCDMPIG